MKSVSESLRDLADQIETTAKQKRPTRHIDNPEPETIIYNALKRIGVPFSVASRLYAKNSAQYMARKIFLYEYEMQTAETKPRAPLKYIQAAIKHNYNETDHFLDWLKQKREKIQYATDSADIDFVRLLSLT